MEDLNDKPVWIIFIVIFPLFLLIDQNSRDFPVFIGVNNLSKAAFSVEKLKKFFCLGTVTYGAQANNFLRFFRKKI